MAPDALGAAAIDGMCDIIPSLGAMLGDALRGAVVAAAPPEQAANITAAAAVRAMGRNFTGRVSCRWASQRPRDHRPSSRGGLGEVVIDRVSAHRRSRIRDPR
jgi:hypothetical protein